MALTGESVRVSLKKEFPAIVNDGGKQGFAQVVMHDGKQESSATIMLPSGKASAENYTAPPALPYVLDAQRFARLDEKERRAFLFGLMGLKTDLAAVKERLLKRQLDAAKIERVLPMLRAGFEAASKDAKTKATEAKGAWRALTGETYGAVKAADWAAQKPELDTAALKRSDEDVARWMRRSLRPTRCWAGCARRSSGASSCRRACRPCARAPAASSGSRHEAGEGRDRTWPSGSARSPRWKVAAPRLRPPSPARAARRSW
jgi:hypothetical protein